MEAALALGMSCRSVGERFKAGPDAVYRHRRDHMSVAHSAALLAELRRKPAEITLENFGHLEADRLLAEIVDHRVRVRAIRDLALAQGPDGFGIALQAEASIRSALSLEMELLAPLLGATLAKNITASPDAVKRIQRIIIEAVPAEQGRPAIREPTPEVHASDVYPDSATHWPEPVEPEPELALPEPEPEPPKVASFAPLSSFGPTPDNVAHLAHLRMRDAFKTKR